MGNWTASAITVPIAIFLILVGALVFDLARDTVVALVGGVTIGAVLAGWWKV